MDAHATNESSDATSDTGLTVHAAVDVLASCELSRCGHRELDIVTGAAQRVRGFLAAADARIARRRDELWHDDMSKFGSPGEGDGPSGDDGSGDGPEGSGDAGHGDTGGSGLGDDLDDELADEFAKLGDRRSGNESDRDRNRARTGHAMPSFETALADGRIDIAHLDAITASLERLAEDEAARAEFLEHEEMLLGYATVERPDRFRRRCTDLARLISRDHGVRHAERQKKSATLKQWWDRNGMWHFHAELDPETAAKVLQALDSHLHTFRQSGEGTGLTWDRLQVESFLQLITGSATLEPHSPEIIAIVDMATLLSGTLGPDGICETSGGQPLPPATIQRLACDANIIPVILGPDRKPFDHGQTRRLASRRQRRALRLMYRTCAHPNCKVAFDRCRMHHILWWENDGPTDLANLLPLCSFHHHQVHEGGWTLTMTADRVTTWITPNGTHWFTGDTSDRMPAPSPALSADAPCRRSPGEVARAHGLPCRDTRHSGTPPDEAPPDGTGDGGERWMEQDARAGDAVAKLIDATAARSTGPHESRPAHQHAGGGEADHDDAPGAAEAQDRRPRRRQQPVAASNPSLFGHESVPAGP